MEICDSHIFSPECCLIISVNRMMQKATPKSTKWTQKCFKIYPEDPKMHPNGVTRTPKNYAGAPKAPPRATKADSPKRRITNQGTIWSSFSVLVASFYNLFSFLMAFQGFVFTWFLVPLEAGGNLKAYPKHCVCWIYC